ncbi:MAG: hypothetical protein KIT72_17115 [Polyangiaceae bacterium]|nr:hypothetical protein [Polyangiaceae bacterium]MCW5792139.1 hypothetical protein [Polyangiaceae bacterium]
MDAPDAPASERPSARPPGEEPSAAARARAWISGTVVGAAASAMRAVKQRPGEAFIGALATSLTLYVVAYPFWVCRYPPLVDLPFHAAQTSIFRHYLDPEFHFREQFSLHPIETPYLSMYLLGAAFALCLSIVSATKLMAICMLLLLPCGLSVLFWGMKKSPLWGLAALPFAWSNLAHWGFLNFLGAVGLYAMCIGLALRALSAPSRRVSIALGVAIFAVFFTHVYRLPFTLLSVALTAVVMYPATRRVRPVLLPFGLGSLALIGWNWVRPKQDTSAPIDLGFHPERLAEWDRHLLPAARGAHQAAERARFDSIIQTVLVLGAVALLLFLWQRRFKGRSRQEWLWGLGVSLLPLLLTGGYLVTYLTLPMEIGEWWYVYPREITTACFIALAVLPDLPRGFWYRVAFVVALGYPVMRLGLGVAQEFADFDHTTEDFTRITQELPPAPKLLYLVFDHSGSPRVSSPYLHLPAWVQAERGGWLSFHFVSFGHSPIRYREGEHRPPPVPRRWEWTPQRYRHQTHGAWFDTFLVRGGDPSRLFAGDPSVKLVKREGRWWLFRREPTP